MRFLNFINCEDPAYEVFNQAMAVVFDEGDPCTEHIDRLSSEARLVYLLWCFDGEIHNGGFDQLFVNSLGNHCIEILGHLQSVGALKSYELLSKAIQWFPDAVPPSDREKRWKAYELFGDSDEYQSEMNALDGEFYKYQDKLNELISSYVRSNAHAKISY